MPLTPSKVLVVGGAGFIGSHFVDRLLSAPETQRVTVYDNFSSGREWHLESHLDDDRLVVGRHAGTDLEQLVSAAEGHDTIIHLASNPDIARAATEPTIDFHQGTALTQNVVEAARRADVELLLYASGSGVYGEVGRIEAQEDQGPLLPISTYGASKLAGEALIASYCFMFGLRARAFRFGNVVGPRQTHGVGFDFVRRLLDDPSQLTILGDGTQSKSYIHVEDVMDAVLTAAGAPTPAFEVYNVATGDYITVTEIAELAVEVVGSDTATRFTFTGGDRGWKGDVPVIRLDTERIRKLGWANGRSTRGALRASLEALIVDARRGRLT
jgi:UDP-glucose 4-epimerase